MGLGQPLKLVQAVPAVPYCPTQLDHPEGLFCSVVDVEHPRFGIIRHHDEQQNAPRIIDPLLDLAFRPSTEGQNQSVLFESVKPEALCARLADTATCGRFHQAERRFFRLSFSFEKVSR